MTRKQDIGVPFFMCNFPGIMEIMSEIVENKISVTSKEVENSISISFKHFQIPESFLKSIQLHQNQLVELTNNINRAMGPMRPSLQMLSQAVTDTYSKLQPVTEAWAKLAQAQHQQLFREIFVPRQIVSSQFIIPTPRREFPSLKEIAEATAEELWKRMEKKKIKTITQQIAVYLSKDGDLYTTEKHQYSLQNEKSRLTLIKNLSPEYKLTKYLLAITGYKNMDSLYKTIQSINQQVKHLLKIKIKLIVGKRGSGYKINQKIKLVRL